jgi:two-component system, response regulator YesN
MYKILIVDDEPEVREGIRDSIRWNEHGFELVGDCADGREALEAVERLKPDLVLSDIYMPFMDGLELTREIAQHHPFTKVIILTGYDSFDYAQQALRLKAYDFILKPITAGEIRTLLDKVKLDMDEESMIREEMTRLQHQLSQSLLLLKERFLERLVTASLPLDEIRERSDYFQIHWLPSSQYIVLVLDADDFGDLGTGPIELDSELLRFAGFNIVSEIMDRNTGITFRTREERTVVILCGPQEDQLYESAYKVAEQFQQCIKRYMKYTFTVGVGRVCGSLDRLALSYKGAVSALDYRFLLGKNRIISIVDMEGSSDMGIPELNAEWSRELGSAIKAGALGEVETRIEQMISSLKSARTPVEACYLHIQKVIVLLMNAVQELGGNEISLFTKWGITLADSYDIKTLDEIERWLKGIVKQVAEFVSEQRSDMTKLQVMRAVDYIEAEYSNEEMSLQHVCRHVLMSASYFSSIFKQHTGETFVEYLTRVRIEKAKELLRDTDMKINDVAEKAGYQPSYFNRIFKKQEGVTPSQYREFCRKM